MQGGFVRKTSPKQAERNKELRQLQEKGDAAAAAELEQLGMRGIYDMFSFCTAAAVCLHGLAGDVASDLCGEHSMLATDVMSNIGEALAISREQMKEEKFLYLQR